MSARDTWTRDTCGTCHGSGTVQKPHFPGQHSTCGTCHGYGEV